MKYKNKDIDLSIFKGKSEADLADILTREGQTFTQPGGAVFVDSFGFLLPMGGHWMFINIYEPQASLRLGNVFALQGHEELVLFDVSTGATCRCKTR